MESWHTYEWVMAHIRMSHGTHTSTTATVVAPLPQPTLWSHGTRIIEGDTHGCVMSHVWRSHILHEYAIVMSPAQKIHTGWWRCIECLIFIEYLPQKSHMISGFFAERHLQLKASWASSPPCTIPIKESYVKHVYSSAHIIVMSHTWLLRTFVWNLCTCGCVICCACVWIVMFHTWLLHSYGMNLVFGWHDSCILM